jgi:nitrate reductase gamma subunit
MESLLEFARGPLFRFCFVIMLLGLIRVFLLDAWSALKAYKKAGDKKMPWKLIFSRAIEWYFPVKRIRNNFHIYSVISILFHIGLIIVPVFLLAHIQLWRESIGISWIALKFTWAFWLIVGTITSTILLLIGRMFIRPVRELSRNQDYFWLILMLIPFVTGFVCSNININPGVYQLLMVVHMLSADLIFLLIPFSKITHCVLAPFSQIINSLAWKFPPESDDDICMTLKEKGTKI